MKKNPRYMGQRAQARLAEMTDEGRANGRAEPGLPGLGYILDPTVISLTSRLHPWLKG